MNTLICAVCLANGARDVLAAVTIAEGTALCGNHFSERDLTPLRRDVVPLQRGVAVMHPSMHNVPDDITVEQAFPQLYAVSDRHAFMGLWNQKCLDCGNHHSHVIHDV